MGEIVVDFWWFLVGELKLKMDCRVSRGSGLGAQEHKLATGLETYLRKTSTRGEQKEEAVRPGPTGLGSLLHISAPSFSSALLAPLLLCVCVLNVVAPSKLSHPLLCLHN
jgi:hypothetical protein